MMPTALITGASSGIGEQFARQFSDRGYDLVLVARRVDRLEKLGEELPTTVHAIACDLGADAASVPAKVAELGVEIDLLVNNAGFGNNGRFVEIEEGSDAEMIRVNCEAVVTLTRAFLPAMVERGSGGVIIVASSAGMQPLPYEATYSASKAFALNFTDALHTEVRDSGVKVMSVNPGPVPTGFQEVASAEDGAIEKMPKQFVIEADQVVRESLTAFDKGVRSFIPGSAFRWFMRVSAIGPRALGLRVAERMYRQ
jgi:short-subunit dehydrogenase